VFNALPARDPPTAPGQAGEQQIDHRRLPNPRVSTNQDELAGALGGTLEPLRQGIDFALAPDDRSGRQKRRDIPVASHKKPIALRSDRFEIPRRRRRIAQCGANFLDTHA
jgi:hypothetical protein